jgi:addiction module HigA family antidote
VICRVDFESNLERATHTMSKLLTTTKDNRAMTPVHPGRILKRELVARELSANRLALSLRVPSGRITSILNGKRAITPETALRLGRYFGNDAQFWMNLQTRYDLIKTARDMGKRIKSEVEAVA